MIAKSIRRTAGETTFKRLAAYVLNEKDGGRGDPVDWRLAEYILDRDNPGEKVASHRITGCLSDDPGWAVKECLALAAQNTRSTKDKAYHLVVSFPEGERPTDEQMADIEGRLVASIGLADHKRISAVHQNTDNWHLHVAIVTVHPQTLRNVTPYYDHLRLQEACVELEVKHGLTRTRHSLLPERALNGRASAVEAHAGRVSFARWVAENAAEPLAAAAARAKTWDDLHRAAAAFGVAIKPRGAGLVVSHQTNKRAHVKASAIDRSLSFKVLTDRLGPYEAPRADLPAPPDAVRYSGQPRGASGELWERYQQERAQATEASAAALASLRAGHLRYAQELQAWYGKRYAAAKAQHLSFADKKSTHHRLDAGKASDHARRKALERGDRQKVKDAHQAVTWAAFLAREASRGDAPAVRALDRLVAGRIEKEGPGRDGAGRG